MTRTSSVTSQTPLADVAELRMGSYLVLGLLFRQPQDDLLANASQIAAELRNDGDLAREFSFYRSWADALDAVAALSETGTALLQAEYASLFEVGNAKSPCPLYESAYLDRTGRDAGLITSRVERAYADAGLALSELAGGELPDHVSLELECMSVLCAREAEAWLAGDRDSALAALGLQKRFLEDHLTAWLPALVRRIGAAAQTEDGIYPMLGEAALAFVIHDVGLVTTLLESAPAPAAKAGGGREQ